MCRHLVMDFYRQNGGSTSQRLIFFVVLVYNVSEGASASAVRKIIKCVLLGPLGGRNPISVPPVSEILCFLNETSSRYRLSRPTCPVVTLCTTYFKTQQDKQCTYNVILRRLHETTESVKRQKLLHISVHACVVCVCVDGWVDGQLRVCAFARVPLIIHHATRRYIVVFDFPGSTIFFHIVS